MDRHKLLLEMRGGVQRNRKIDFIKGIAIILVVWGHFVEHFKVDYNYYGDIVHIFIFSFHMPLFSVVSGYLAYYSMKKRTAWAFLLKSLKAYLYPLLVWTVISILIRCFCNGVLAHKSVDLSFHTLISELFGNGFWFLWSIFGCSLCALFAEKVILRKRNNFLYALVWPLLYLLPCSERSIYLYPYYVLGLFVSKYTLEQKGWYNMAKYGLAILFLIMLPFYREEHYIYVSGITPGLSNLSVLHQLAVDGFRWLIGLSGIAFVLVIIGFIEKRDTFWRTKSLLGYLGTITMEIYLMQAIALNYLLVMVVNRIDVIRLLSNNLSQSAFVYDFVVTPVFTLIYLLANIAIIKGIKKSAIMSKILFFR